MRSFGKTPKMVEWLGGKLGQPFPWPKYYQIASKFIGGAMENISLVTWTDLYVMDETLYKERGLGVELTNIHEMAHTYFGDLIVIRHFDHAWLKESWATYFEALWLEDTWNNDEFRYEMYGNAERYFAETNKYVRPIVTNKYEYSWAMFDSHTYPGKFLFN
jgi:aminopeptidase N